MKQIILESEKDEMTIEEALEMFRINFPLTRGINVQDTYISYSIGNFASVSCWIDAANNIIKSFGLPLRVKTWSADLSKGVLTIESNSKK